MMEVLICADPERGIYSQRNPALPGGSGKPHHDDMVARVLLWATPDGDFEKICK